MNDDRALVCICKDAEIMRMLIFDEVCLLPSSFDVYKHAVAVD